MPLIEAFTSERAIANGPQKLNPRKAPMKLKEAIAEIMRCRIVDPARAAMLETQVLRRGASVNLDPTDNPEQKAARAMFGLV